jgi:5'-deoxynucleotidase YfbR-like HD superfamily hydrolase
LVDREHALAALLHDAAEAYIGDVASPLKHQLPDYKVIEDRVEAAVFKHFNLAKPFHPSVKRADLIMLATEQRDLMPEHGDRWACLQGIEPMPQRLDPMPAQTARYCFLDRYFELTSDR